ADDHRRAVHLPVGLGAGAGLPGAGAAVVGGVAAGGGGGGAWGPWPRYEVALGGVGGARSSCGPRVSPGGASGRRLGGWPAGVAGLCCLPILVWNGQHGWVTVRHVGGLAGVRNSAGVLWAGPAVYVGTQAALLLGFWFVAWAAAMIAHRPGREKDAAVGYLW